MIFRNVFFRRKSTTHFGVSPFFRRKVTFVIGRETKHTFYRRKATFLFFFAKVSHSNNNFSFEAINHSTTTTTTTTTTTSTSTTTTTTISTGRETKNTCYIRDSTNSSLRSASTKKWKTWKNGKNVTRNRHAAEAKKIRVLSTWLRKKQQQRKKK